MKKCTFLKNTLWLIPIFCVKLKKLAENLWKDATRNDRQLCVSCLIVWGFTSHSRIFHSYGDVTIIGEMLQILTYARQLWQWGFFSVLHLLWHNISINNGHFRGPVTLKSISERLAIQLLCFYGLGLSRLGFELATFRMRGEPFNRLRHRGGFNSAWELMNVYIRCFEC